MPLYIAVHEVHHRPDLKKDLVIVPAGGAMLIEDDYAESLGVAVRKPTPDEKKLHAHLLADEKEAEKAAKKAEADAAKAAAEKEKAKADAAAAKSGGKSDDASGMV